MSLLLEACLNYAFSPQQVAVGLAGLIKIGDIVSDVLFILDLKEWHKLFGRSWLFDGEEKTNYKTYLVAAIVFTAVGIAFDLCMCYMVVKDRQKKNTVSERIKRGFRSFAGMFFDADEGKGEEWAWWKHSNLVLEEIPQLLILLCFFADYYRGCESCSGDQKQYMTSLYISAIVSTIFTCLTIVRVLVGIYRAWCRDRARKEQESMSVLPTFQSKEPDRDEKGRVERKMKQLKDSIQSSVPDRLEKGKVEKKMRQLKESIQSNVPDKLEKGKIEKKMRQLKESIRPPGKEDSRTQAPTKQSKGDARETADTKLSESASGKARTSGRPGVATQVMRSMAPKAAASDSSCDSTEPENFPITPNWKCVAVSELTESLFFCRQQNQ